jgi:hypothetical protein
MGKALACVIVILLVGSLVGMTVQRAASSSQQVFTSQDAVVPGLPLTLDNGTDVPMPIEGITGGQELWPTYSSPTIVEGSTFHTVAYVYLNYGDVPQEVIGMYNETAQTYLSLAYMQSFQNNSDFRVITMDSQSNSRTLIVITTQFVAGNYYQGYAFRIVYDPQHPNFEYYIHVDGIFTSDSELVNIVNLLDSHFAAVVASKQLNPKTPTVTAVFADGTTNGTAGATLTVSGGNWTPNTQVTLTSGCFNAHLGTVVTQADSVGGFSLSVLTGSVLEPGTWTIIAQQGSLSANTKITIYTPSQSTSQTSQGAGGFFLVSSAKGDCYVQRGGTGPWILIEPFMEIYPGDAIKSSRGSVSNTGIWVDYFNSEGGRVYGMALDDGAVVLLGALPPSNPYGALGAVDVSPDPTIPESRFDVYFESSPQIGRWDIQVPVGVIHDADNAFELIGNSSETTVYLFNGTLEVSDLTGNNTVTVGANQTVTMAAGGLITAPTAFDPTTVDQWWTAVMPSSSNTSTGTSTVTSTNTSANAFSMRNLLSGNTLYVVLIVVIAIVVLGLIMTRRRGGGGQAPPKGMSITQTVNVLPPPSAKAEVKTTKYCQACGTANAASAQFCRSCGKRFST